MMRGSIDLLEWCQCYGKEEKDERDSRKGIHIERVSERRYAKMEMKTELYFFDKLQYGEEDVDLGGVEQLVEGR